ncbi:MAG: helix-turn-helix domain-containing protein [Patescibacteria group bacterium]|nr:hypothetical protein [Patescibacteria group bacterium]
MKAFLSKLIQLGFTSNEAAVYIAALQLETASAQSIAELAQVNRATTYSVLKSLMKKGLITEFRQAHELRYAAESPEVIHALLALEERELTARKEIALPIVNRLQVFFQKNEKKPRIRYVESEQGLRVLQQEFESLDDDLLQIVGLDTFRTLYGDLNGGEHLNKLSEQGRRIRSIMVTDSPISYPSSLNVECVTISPDLVSVKGEMTVCGDRVALFSYSDGLVAIDIISITIADMVRSTLELAWNEAKRLGK